MADLGTRRALVTGASSGIGEAFAERLGRDGFDLIIVGRRRDRLHAVADRIQRNHGVNVQHVVADLSNPTDLKEVEGLLVGDGVTVLVNNAGFTHLRPFIELDADQAEEMIRVHVVALTRLTRAALPAMMARGRGDIINVSSDGIFVTYPEPVMATYAATKAYVNKFTQAIHRQGAESGIRAQALCAGFVRTEILERHGISFDDWAIPDSAVMSPQQIVDVSLCALQLGEVICVPTLDDVALLRQINELQEVVRERSSSTGAPARRYFLADPS